MLRQYPGRGNPVRRALTGRLPVRQLRVMVEHLDLDRPLSLALGGGGWVYPDWMLHDVSAQLRALVAMTHNIHRDKGSQPLELVPLWHPALDVDDEISTEQSAAEAELSALMHREG